MNLIAGISILLVTYNQFPE